MPTMEAKPGHQRSELRDDKGRINCRHPSSACADDQMDRVPSGRGAVPARSLGSF
jgi:hypothetical protein